MTVALFLACGMVTQYRAQRVAAAASAPRGAGGGPVELLTFEMLHDPHCKAEEQMLFEVNAKGHIRFDRPADTRKDSVAVHVLRDRHSLAADLRDLEREQAALKKRVSKLRIQDVLPFRVAAGQSLVRRGSKHPGKLYPEALAPPTRTTTRRTSCRTPGRSPSAICLPSSRARSSAQSGINARLLARTLMASSGKQR